MGKCVLCGKPAGWFASEHRECREEQIRSEEAATAARLQAEARELEYREALVRRLADGIREGVAIATLELMVADEMAEGRLDTGSRKQIVVKSWEAAAEHFLEDGTLSDDESTRLLQFQDRLFVDLKEVDEVLRTRVGQAAVLQSVMSDDPLKGVDAPGLPINFRSSEQVIWIWLHDVDYYEDRERREWKGRSQGVSVRVMSGVYYRVGAFKGEPVYTTERRKLGTGLLVATDQNLYFHSSTVSIRVPYNKIVGFTPYKDGIGIQREGTTAKPQTFVTGDGWFIYNLLTNLARRAT